MIIEFWVLLMIMFFSCLHCSYKLKERDLLPSDRNDFSRKRTLMIMSNTKKLNG